MFSSYTGTFFYSMLLFCSENVIEVFLTVMEVLGVMSFVTIFALKIAGKS